MECSRARVSLWRVVAVAIAAASTVIVSGLPARASEQKVAKGGNLA
jgi:hypothetical protein